MVLHIVIVFFIISPFFPAINNPHWFFRTADFVRLQSLFIQLILLVLLFFSEDRFTVFTWILLGLLAATISYQAFKVFPYSSLVPRKKIERSSDGQVSILAGNVLQTNSNYHEFLGEINRFDPDLVLTMESNKDWESGLSEIEKVYRFNIKVPIENFYGMHLYSKIELQNVEVKYQIEDDKPSIFFDFPLEGN